MCFTALPPLSGAQSPPRLEPFFSRAFLASDPARLRTGTVAISTAGALRTLLDSLPAKTATAAHARNDDQLPAQPHGNGHARLKILSKCSSVIIISSSFLLPHCWRVHYSEVLEL